MQISMLFATLMDDAGLRLCFQWELSRKFLFAPLLVNVLSRRLSSYMVVVYVMAHPPEAQAGFEASMLQ